MNNTIPTTINSKHQNRDKFFKKMINSIIRREKKVDIIGKTDELNENAIFKESYKPKYEILKRKPTPKNNSEEMKVNPFYDPNGGKPKKSRKSRKTRKNRKSKRKL